MVARGKAQIFLMLLLFSTSSFISIIPARAQNIRYHIEHQYSTIWVNNDGTLDLLYEIDIACDSGKVSAIYVGQPAEGFTLGEAFDERGNKLQIAKDFQEGPAVEVVFQSPVNAGSRLRFNLTTNVQKMIWEDNMNPGNVGLQFIPTWWDEVVKELRVRVVLPPGATIDKVRNTPDWDNNFLDPETGGLVLYWERFDLAANAKFTVGVSFPKELVSQFEVERTGFDAFLHNILLPNMATIIAGIILLAVLILIIRRAAKKLAYEKPKLMMESLGARRGLTAVEAAWLLGLGPVKVVVAMLYGLLQKRAVWVTESEPKLKLQVMPEFKDSTGTRDSPLRYYEHRFIDSIGEDGTLNENGLAASVSLVRDTVEQKMRGYNRGETVKYYSGVVEQAWKQVDGAGTPELASAAFDENLLWLYMDGEFGIKLKTGFENRVFLPNNDWWWYWWWMRPNPLPPTPGPPGPTGEVLRPQPLPGGEFADKIVTSLERSANGLVTNLEKFADAVAPARAETSRAPARRGSGGSCACANCACACACVSCACACAGGRVR